MTKLGELYTDFSRIDLDTRGGYARVARTTTHTLENIPEHCAFKLMRPENDYQKGAERFEDELRILTKISSDNNAPTPITRIHDSGYVQTELSTAFQLNETPDPKLEIYTTGTKPDDFIQIGKATLSNESKKWLPYLVVDLAPYDDNLLRQIHHKPKDDPYGIYRLPTGEVIAMAIQLLSTMEYFHTTHGRAYIDWKPEHLFWNGLNKQVRLIDWNVTVPLEDGPGEKQNIRDDIRLFCGAVLYIGLTFSDPENPKKPIGPRPTDEIQNPISEIRARYWTDNPNFYQYDTTLDEKIKQIIRKGLDPKQGFESPNELRGILLDYAKQEWGTSETELLPYSEPKSQYFQVLAEIRKAQHQFHYVQQNLFNLTETKGEDPEFIWLFEIIKRALVNFPGS